MHAIYTSEHNGDYRSITLVETGETFGGVAIAIQRHFAAGAVITRDAAHTHGNPPGTVYGLGESDFRRRVEGRIRTDGVTRARMAMLQWAGYQARDEQLYNAAGAVIEAMGGSSLAAWPYREYWGLWRPIPDHLVEICDAVRALGHRRDAVRLLRGPMLAYSDRLKADPSTPRGDHALDIADPGPDGIRCVSCDGTGEVERIGGCDDCQGYGRVSREVVAYNGRRARYPYGRRGQLTA